MNIAELILRVFLPGTSLNVLLCERELQAGAGPQSRHRSAHLV